MFIHIQKARDTYHGIPSAVFKALVSCFTGGKPTIIYSIPNCASPLIQLLVKIILKFISTIFYAVLIFSASFDTMGAILKIFCF